MADYVLIADRCLIAVIFGVAFVTKVRGAAAFRRFADTVRTLTRFRRPAATGIAALVVAGEAITTILVVLPGTVRLGFAAAAGLLAVFIAVVFRAVQVGVLAECRCFGRGSVMSSAMVLRNLLLMAAAVTGVATAPGAPVPDVGLLLVAGAIGVALAVFFIRYYDALVRLLLGRLSPQVDT
ncbi:putative membrane protein YphA (DoxX/SURF4 family) [Actinoalloteichus hoggarensis]|uniref:Methylamine utilisation protein MauE domain-containing protein n=1 Tax=Actinoalloteichus hoggarensis TaxID=1470176 RepID=A0A221W001_9PSEU|nr:MauE/DoxX family redox-associated membrane protein [Actinoalloteichus hoggarensis]ASO19092.1 hypothetical protein AHOG_07220 [Actinoalloteichus hoggarensis]MBB5920329.1 putative membrane protein YphA (DoxX/SURF4 family) [Actinoalloteichus hoggarensis]